MQLKSILAKLKSKKKSEIKTKDIPPNTPETSPEAKEPISTKEEEKSQPIKEYHEVIYSKGTIPKDKKSKKQTDEANTWKPTHWDGINTIEKNVDTINSKTKYHATATSDIKDSDIDRKVDLLIKKKHK
jgi:hypothetical protein